MGIESTVSDRSASGFINQAVKSSASYGGTGGNAFVSSFGSYVTKLTTYSSSGYPLSGLAMTFDNGDVSKVGGTTTVIGHLDLTSDSIAKMYVETQKNSTSFGGNNIGIVAIYIETVRGVQFASPTTASPVSNPTGWTLVCDATSGSACQNVVLVGMSGRADKGLDAVTILYKDDILLSRSMDTFDYSALKQTPGKPINVATATVHNQTNQQQQMSIGFEKSVSSSFTWSVTAGVTIGASATFTTGVPFVAKGEVQVSAEISFSATIGETHTVTEAFSYTAQVIVPANSAIIANAVASSSNVSGTYTARYVENWAHAGLVTSNVSGSINGLSAYNVQVDYTDGT